MSNHQMQMPAQYTSIGDDEMVLLCGGETTAWQTFQDIGRVLNYVARIFGGSSIVNKCGSTSSIIFNKLEEPAPGHRGSVRRGRDKKKEAVAYNSLFVCYSLVVQLVSGQCLEHGQHGSSLSLCGGQVHVAVVTALRLACAGDIALERSHEAEGLHRQAQRLGGGQAQVSVVKAGGASAMRPT